MLTRGLTLSLFHHAAHGARLAIVLAVSIGAWLGMGFPAAFAQTLVVEFHHGALDHYFVTSSASEIADLDNGMHAGWKRTGLSFPAYPAGSGGSNPGTVPVCRFYGNPAMGLDSHFYAADVAECAAVRAKFPESWLLESEEVFRAMPVGAAGVCASHLQPVFRLWNNRPDVNHRYTTSTTMFDAMTLKGSIPEGSGTGARPVIFCMPVVAAAGVPDCTFSASTATPTLGTTLVLTASCTGAPTAFAWSGCSSNNATCNVAATVAGPATYTVQAVNSAGAGTKVPLTVTWSPASGGGGGGGTGPFCTVSVDNATPTVGTSAMLSANCSQAPASYVWMSCSFMLQTVCNVLPACPGTSSTCKVSESNPGFAHYALDATNAAGTARAGRDVEWIGAYEPPTVPTCFVSASEPAPLVNGVVTLTAFCSGNPSSFTWTGCASNQSSCSATSDVAGVKSYWVTAANGAGSSAMASVQVTWMQPGPPVPPVCTLFPSATAPTVGETITISAACSGNPGSYAWTGCNSTGASCQSSAPAAGHKVYTVTATNVAGAGSGAVTINWQAPVITPVCTLSANKSTAAVGDQLTLTAACTNAPTGYAWNGCASTSATCQTTATATGRVTYSVSGRNAYGTGTAATASVNWVPAGTASDFCAAYPIVVRRSIGWGDNSRMLTAGWDDNQGFRAQAVLVLSFTVPTYPVAYAIAGNSSISEYQDPATSRQLTLSRSACDFRGTDGAGANGPYATSFGNTALVAWNVGAGPASLVPGETYYLNIRNYSPDLGGLSCFRSTCNAAIVTNWPKNN